MILLIKNGHVINPATETDEVADILAEDGKVVKMEKNIKAKADRVIDAKGCYVMPGFIDMHVHLRDPGQEQKETIETGCNAAAHGGYTTILAMPNTKPVVDNPDVVKYVQNKAKTVGVVNVLQVGAITKGQQGKELADIRGMYEAGIPAISEDGRSVMNSELYREAMEIAAELDIPVLAHCEDINLVNGGVMNEDAHAKELGLRGITNSVEDIIVARDIMLSGDTRAKLHLCHCSTRDSVKMVRYAKMEQMKVTAEVCPHHFTLTSDDIHKIEPSIDQEKKLAIDADADTNFKMNPPLRSREDVQALKEGLRDNIMEVALDYLSVGIDPAKSHIFIQSYVTELTELTFYYQNLVTVSRLQRNPTVKAEIQMRNFEASIPVGFFNYPISQAADITAFHATTVPVGEDQMPMLEQTKEIVHKFNAVYGETLTDPQILLPDNKACLRLPGTDGKAKMSKSLGNCIYLSESEADVKKKIMSMFTDPEHIRIEDPGKLEGNTVFTYLDAFCTDGHFAEYLPEYANLDELKAHYKRGGLGDVKVKKFLNNVMQEELSPIRARRKEYEQRIGDVYDILKAGSEVAKEEAAKTLSEVKHAMKIDYFDTPEFLEEQVKKYLDR